MRESITGVDRPSDHELLRRAIEGAHTERGSTSSARWSCVGQALSVGSTTATRLCVEFGLDPDEQLEGQYCEGCPWIEEMEEVTK